MRLILVFAAVLSVALAGGPPRNNIRRGGPFHQHGSTPARPPRSHYSHQSLSPFSHSNGHGPHGSGRIGHSNYAYIAGRPPGRSHSSHGHHHQYHHQVVGGGGGELSSLTHAYSPVEPPVLSVAPIIPYEPDVQLPAAYPDLGPGPGPATSTISKSVYVFSAPQDPTDHIRPQIVKKFPQQKQKHYQVLFINAPNPPPHPQHTVELPPPPELKTQIYVLVKKPQPAPPVKIIPAKVPVHKPEVYFIRYKNNQGGGFAPVPSDAPITYPQPQILEHDQPQKLIYHDQPQLAHFPYHQPQEEYQLLDQPGFESPQEYTSIVPVQEHEHQLEYAPQQPYQGQELQYISGQQEEVPQFGSQHGGGELQYTEGDPYSDYSRLSAHYSTVTGRPVQLPSSRLWNKKKSNKLRRRKTPVSRSDNHNEKWTPIISNRKVEKRELDAGMSGI